MNTVGMISLEDIADDVTVAYVGPTTAHFCSTGGIPYLRTGNVGKSELLLSELKFVTSEFHLNQKKSSLKPGDVLISRVISNEVHCGIVPASLGEANCGNVIVVRPGTRLHAPFLIQFIRFPVVQQALIQRRVGSAQSVVNTSILKALKVPAHSLDEQRRIADVLDRAEALRAKRRAALAELDGLAQSVFLEMFGDPVTNPKQWPRVEFADVLAEIESGWSPVCLDRTVADHEWGVLKLGAVTQGEYRPFENKALPPDIRPDPSLEVQVGDLLFSRKNTYDLVAACALVRSTPPRLMLPDLIFRLRLKPNCKVRPEYIHQLISNSNKRSDIQRLASGTSGSMPNISKGRLMNYFIEVPPLPLQQEFAECLGAVEKLKAVQRASLAELDALFASLQDRAFRGAL